jgi:putative membrane protein
MPVMAKIAPLFVTLVTAFALVALAEDKMADSSADAKFMMNAARGGMAEVKMGELAKTKANNADVKRFGDMMVHDHTKANDELIKLAKSKNVTLPTDLGEHQATHDRLAKLDGDAFDREYVHEMIEDHTKDVSEFQAEADGGQDADVKKWATETLPTLKDHLKAAQEMMDRVGGGAATKPAMEH